MSFLLSACDAEPLHIDSVELTSGGRIGMTHCPGRRGVDGDGCHWSRDLGRDLAAIAAWPARIVVTLLEARELNALGVPDLHARMREMAFAWHHVPIPDMHAPGQRELELWHTIEIDLVAALRRGERILLHCAAGLGRSGTMAARLLVDHFGYTPEAAVAAVRRCRPGAIETRGQEQFVLMPRGAVDL